MQISLMSEQANLCLMVDAAELRKMTFAATFRSTTVDLKRGVPSNISYTDMHASDAAEQHISAAEINTVIKLFKCDVNSSALTIVVGQKQYAAPAVN